MIRRSDGPKTYWGYYQDYLEEISGKKIQKKFHRFSAKIIRLYSMAKKTAETQVAADFQIWSKNWMYVSSIISWCQYGQLL